MALVNINNMVVLDNPTTFNSMFQFEITFECLQELDDDLEWKVLYVANAQDTSKDIVLEEVLVGPVPVGINKFILQADAPDAPTQLSANAQEWLGVTVVLVTCSYREREFVRVGYYVNNGYEGYDPESTTTTTTSQDPKTDGDDATKNKEEAQSSVVAAQPPPPSLSQLDVSKVIRTILADKPRVTKFPIPWGDDTTTTTSSTSDAGQQADGSSSGGGNEENRAPSNNTTTDPAKEAAPTE
uniref:Anti-silencing function protein 1 n=1 Tax=Grammatophora oceanica TaxID=210454 RepID=A0A7S1UQG1_9STRA|mmetsp:Transcript_14689/g.21618  ORF Transcript_14689/g.21618 Transcript_14689/m.21618 type:complete len:241 (+) Transcript_14689:93-815(+)